MNKNEVLLKDVMTKDVVSVYPESPVEEAMQKISKNNFNGLPVIDHENKIVGIITQYDLINNKSSEQMPTVQSIMNNNPLTLSENSTFAQTVKVFRKHHRVNPIPVTDAEGKLCGIVSRFDIMLFILYHKIF